MPWCSVSWAFCKVQAISGKKIRWHSKRHPFSGINAETDGDQSIELVLFTKRMGNCVKIDPSYLHNFSAFFYGLNLRESCYQCRFATSERVADLTIGDFWGSWNKYKKRFREGISVVGVNSERGYELSENISGRFDFYEVLTENEAILSNDNFTHPIKRPPERACFYDSILSKGYKGLWIKSYLSKSYRRKTLTSIYGAFVPEKIRMMRHRK